LGRYLVPYCADGTIFDISITCVILCIYGLCARTLREGVVTDLICAYDRSTCSI
jgi:hypothetical protein